MFLKHQNFTMFLQIPFRDKNKTSVQIKLPCPACNVAFLQASGAEPSSKPQAGRIHGFYLPSTQSEQVTPIANLSHLQPQGHT